MASLSRTSLLRTLPRTTFKFAPPLPLLRTRLPPPTTLRRSPVLTATRTVTYRRFGDNNIAIRSSPWRPQSGGGRQKYIYWAAGLGAVWIVFHLERVPETGRWRYMDTSEALEISMGEQMYQETLDQFRGKILPPNHPTSRYVQKVAKRIIMASELPRSSSSEADMGEHHGSGSAGAARSEKIEWRVHVVNDPSTLNAFVAPGGKVFVFTGILPVCADEDGLAAVLAHEVAHQVARHMGERMSLAKIALLVAFGIDALLGIGVGASQAIVNLCLSLPNSRTNESEGADSPLATRLSS